MKLTISICTYNRPECIQRQVRDVIKQLQADVQLVVFDNCSSIPVSSLFTPEELEKVSIYRNQINIGGPQNQVRCIESVNSGWVWTLSDDDEIKPNAIQIILDQIEKYQDSCYINFGNKKNAECNSFEELMNYLSIVGALGLSFFQSNCVYNVNRIKKSILWFNDFLSSQMGQICMIIKHMELYENERCVFLSEKLLLDSQEGHWSKLKFIVNSSLIIDKLHYNKRKLKSTLFKGFGDLYFPMLASCNLTISEFLYYNSLLRNKLGIYNILRYNFITYSGFIAKQILPHKLFLKIRNIIATKYNKNIKKQSYPSNSKKQTK